MADLTREQLLNLVRVQQKYLEKFRNEFSAATNYDLKTSIVESPLQDEYKELAGTLKLWESQLKQPRTSPEEVTEINKELDELLPKLADYTGDLKHRIDAKKQIDKADLQQSTEMLQSETAEAAQTDAIKKETEEQPETAKQMVDSDQPPPLEALSEEVDLPPGENTIVPSKPPESAEQNTLVPGNEPPAKEAENALVPGGEPPQPPPPPPPQPEAPVEVAKSTLAAGQNKPKDDGLDVLSDEQRKEAARRVHDIKMSNERKERNAELFRDAAMGMGKFLADWKLVTELDPSKKEEENNGYLDTLTGTSLLKDGIYAAKGRDYNLKIENGMISAIPSTGRHYDQAYEDIILLMKAKMGEGGKGIVIGWSGHGQIDENKIKSMMKHASNHGVPFTFNKRVRDYIETLPKERQIEYLRAEKESQQKLDPLYLVAERQHLFETAAKQMQAQPKDFNPDNIDSLEKYHAKLTELQQRYAFVNAIMNKLDSCIAADKRFLTGETKDLDKLNIIMKAHGEQTQSATQGQQESLAILAQLDKLRTEVAPRLQAGSITVNNKVITKDDLINQTDRFVRTTRAAATPTGFEVQLVKAKPDQATMQANQVYVYQSNDKIEYSAKNPKTGAVITGTITQNDLKDKPKKFKGVEEAVKNPDSLTAEQRKSVVKAIFEVTGKQDITQLSNPINTIAESNARLYADCQAARQQQPQQQPQQARP